MASHFINRYKKDLSTQALKTKLVRQKSLLQKESRHKEFNRGRQFGPVDVNTQASRDGELSRLDDTGEGHSTNSSAKPRLRIPVLNRAKETATKASCTRAANYISKGVSQAAQLKQVYVDKPLLREKKGLLVDFSNDIPCENRDTDSQVGALAVRFIESD
ncbi:hypothetical protein JRQ81_008590 [Phrynocephalus forsythii]|uniref:Uncharacterized protein n=1 Tax=Phrynocephalus forsythii TaxID=171643 RepID=A0A9Q0XCB5_9SAUR|nr:hypothetical protein JRQ81_008590 [Phrynocephalus forsythii]